MSMPFGCPAGYTCYPQAAPDMFTATAQHSARQLSSEGSCDMPGDIHISWLVYLRDLRSRRICFRGTWQLPGFQPGN
jgi:hypothetical protein